MPLQAAPTKVGKQLGGLWATAVASLTNSSTKFPKFNSFEFFVSSSVHVQNGSRKEYPKGLKTPAV